MNMEKPGGIELIEYVPARFTRDEIPDGVGETIWRNYSNQIAVDFPSPKTDGHWQLTAQGWVGYIPLMPGLGLALRPKVKLGNLFGMLEYAYQLRSFHFLDGLIDCQSLEEFYEQLANILAQRILDRGRKGFYRAYLAETERLSYIRGRLDLKRVIQAAWDVKIKCHYEEHTADIEDNRILAWTLSCIARSGMCTERVLPTVRRTYRGLQGFVTLLPYSPDACVGRFYNRLNDDYQPLHALCRFFLEQSGPGHDMGNRAMLPFLVDMASLYELFVTEWLRAHLPQGIVLKSQERVNIGQGKTLHFEIDLVLYDIATGAARYVLDTKYKASSAAAPDDLKQVVAYAAAKGCHEAILIYPTPLAEPLDTTIGDIRIRSLIFSLDSDLDQAGQAFIHDLLHDSPVNAGG